MIAEFEQRLADVLGSELPAPFTGRVQVEPGSGGGSGPHILLGVERTDVLPSAIGDPPEMVVPGDPQPRRIVRARCTVRLRVVPTEQGGRAQERSGLDAALFALDAPAFRNGHALAGEVADPGFLIRATRILSATLPIEGDDSIRTGLVMEAEGWFWPVGTPGASGPQIQEIRIRGAVMPLSLDIPGPLIAGGEPVALSLSVRSSRLALSGDGETSPPPGIRLALRLVTPGGAPGAGTLQGSTGGVLRVDIANEAVAFTYEPPAEPTREYLVVAYEDGEGGVGQEVARFLLTVETVP